MDPRPNPFSLRIDEFLMNKLRIVADTHKRSATKEIELLIERAVSQFEKDNGEIFIQWKDSK